MLRVHFNLKVKLRAEKKGAHAYFFASPTRLWFPPGQHCCAPKPLVSLQRWVEQLQH